MKRTPVIIVSAALLACCLFLTACAGSTEGADSSATSSAAASSTPAAASSEPAATSSAQAASSTPAAASSASSAAADEGITPEFKEYADNYIAEANKLAEIAKKGKELGSYKAIEEEWTAQSEKISALADEGQVWAEKYNNDELTAADKAYYDDVFLPAMLDAASAGLELIDLIENDQ